MIYHDLLLKFLLTISYEPNSNSALAQTNKRYHGTIDSGKITILTASNMSTAFDTLDHITLQIQIVFITTITKTDEI